ncbi:MAG: hypothetical protein JWN43_1600 [Gammaproteobacteria bacterium]|nr:hypothetical protein [Gammaproteobacteria bacterium]
MANENVTPIRPLSGPPSDPPPPKTRRAKRAPKVSLGSLADPDTFRGFTTHDLISALHGVCVVLDSAIVDGAEFENHHNTMCGLAQAGKVLSSILNIELHS